jgi:hypothetical protein
MTTFNDIKRRFNQLERNARKQIKVLQKGVEQGLPPRIPIGPGPIGAMLKALRKLRREVNKNLGQVERSLQRALLRARKG